MTELPYTIVRKVIHGQEVDVKVYPRGASNYSEEDSLDEWLSDYYDNDTITVKHSDFKLYLKGED